MNLYTKGDAFRAFLFCCCAVNGMPAAFPCQMNKTSRTEKKDPCHESRGPHIIQQYFLFSDSRFQAVHIEALVPNDIIVAIVIDLNTRMYPAGCTAIIH